MRAILLTMPILLSATVLTGCSTSGPASVGGLERVIGTSLPGAQGKTRADQVKIDRTVARGCAGGVYKQGLCETHTKASAARYEELGR